MVQLSLLNPLLNLLKNIKKYTNENGYILYVYLRLLAREDLVIIVPCRHNLMPSFNSNHQLLECLTLFIISTFKKIGKPLSW